MSPPPPQRFPRLLLAHKAAALHQRVPLLRNLPLRVLGIIGALAGANAVVWIVVGIVLRFHGALASTAVLAYTLGLRHALDADHISAIDLTTRRLIAAGQRPVTVGLYFSLGHSTIVIITSLVVAASANAITKKFEQYSRIGAIVGTSVSAGFLLVLGAMNVYVLGRLVAEMRRVVGGVGGEEGGFRIEGAGCLGRVLGRLFWFVDRPWKMYPLGVLFGLGFDTSSEIALLGISSIQGAKGTSLWLILIFPALFTGMTLLDTIDGALIMTLYTTTPLSRDPLAILYYSIILTALTIAIALTIGVIQLLTLILRVKGPTGRFWDGVGVVGDHYDVIGGAICGSFVLFGGLSVLLYRPWRRRVDQTRERNIQRARLESGDDRDEEVLEEGPRPARTSSEDITNLERGQK